MPTLADLTTLRVGGPAQTLVTATTEADLIAAVAEADAAETPVLLVGGGSNLVVSDEGFDGTVVLIATRGIDLHAIDACGGVMVTVAAGEPWDRFVAHAVANGWAGVEALAGIPGLTGATPVQNVGAYGQEVAATIARVRTWDREADAVRTFANVDCDFGYRTSMFKHSDRWVVLDVTFQLRPGALSEPVRYAELARALGVEVSGRVPLTEVPPAVLSLRRAKGMVLDPDDHDTWSAGSFFTNPVVDTGTAEEIAARVGGPMPSWPVDGDRIKLAAAWLIQNAGFEKGLRRRGVGLSSKHVLALVHHGDGTTAELLALAREIRDAVLDRFGVRLRPEPVPLGFRTEEISDLWPVQSGA
jgi:UDP-N-acetylmuramate dehydrogenase